jgi:hypothetical protein
MIGRGDLAGQCDGEARGSDGASTRSFALLRRAFPRQPALILAQGLYLFSAVHAARRAWPAGVWTFPRTDFGPRPKVLPRNLVDAAEVHAGKPQLAANEEQGPKGRMCLASSPNRNRPRTRNRPRFRDPWVGAGLLPANACGSPPGPKLKAEDEFEFDYD